jgi:hypothetical protein
MKSDGTDSRKLMYGQPFPATPDLKIKCVLAPVYKISIIRYAVIINKVIIIWI